MNDTFVIITKKNCPWCDKAKEALNQHKKFFVEFSLESHTILMSFLKVQGFTSVPQIWYQGDVIPGGYAGLENYLAIEALD